MDGLPAADRAQAGDVLAALGDPRFDPQRCYLPDDDMLGFVRIEADTDFMIGSRKADGMSEEETNDVVTPTRLFYIGRYPVTVAQFRVFVEATKFETR